MTLIEGGRTPLIDSVQAPETEVRKTRGRPKSVEGGNRLHIYIPDTLTKRLVEIQRETHASSLTEVVKAALQLYAAAIEEHKNGGHVYFKRKDEGTERQLALFI
ncbi:MAG: hypothetical protein WAM62_14850 [Pseudolabrys sp.]